MTGMRSWKRDIYTMACIEIKGDNVAKREEKEKEKGELIKER